MLLLSLIETLGNFLIQIMTQDIIELIRRKGKRVRLGE